MEREAKHQDQKNAGASCQNGEEILSLSTSAAAMNFGGDSIKASISLSGGSKTDT